LNNIITAEEITTLVASTIKSAFESVAAPFAP